MAPTSKGSRFRWGSTLGKDAVFSSVNTDAKLSFRICAIDLQSWVGTPELSARGPTLVLMFFLALMYVKKLLGVDLGFSGNFLFVVAFAFPDEASAQPKAA